MELSKLYQDAQAAGARVYGYNIGFAGAATIEISAQYGIFIDYNYFSSLCDLSWAIAHEIGHCATGCTQRVSSPYDLIEKHEYKADRWAYEEYLPVIALQEAMHAGYTTPWEIAEWLDVPEAAVQNALYYWVECRGVDFNGG